MQGCDRSLEECQEILSLMSNQGNLQAMLTGAFIMVRKEEAKENRKSCFFTNWVEESSAF